MKFLTAFFLSLTLFAQTAQFPGSIATIQQLGQVANGVTGTLNNSLTTSSTSLNITNGTCTLAGQSTSCSVAFQPNMFITVQNEIMQICSMSAGSGIEVLNFGIIGSSCPSLSGRGLDGTQIAAHTTPSFPNKITVNNNITAWTHNANSAEIIAIENRDGPVTTSVMNYGAIADGVGTTGTDQLSKINAAALAIHNDGGGILIFPAAANGKCFYIDGSIQIYSSTTVRLDKGGCVQTAAGNIGTNILGGPVFEAGLSNTTNHDIWFEGFGTVDGNNANITGTGDLYNQGINYESCSNCGGKDITVKNAWTGGISIACTSGTPGNNVQLLNVTISGSRRNNLEELCGTNTKMIGGSLISATGGTLSLGADIEPFACGPTGCGGTVSGFTLNNVIISGNRDGCIGGITPFDTDPIINFINVQCSSPVNMDGLHFVQNNGAPGASVLNIIGGSYITSGTATGALEVEGFNIHNVVGVTAIGGTRGLIIGDTFPSPIANSFAYVANSTLSGSVYDLDNNAFTTIVNTKLQHGIYNTYANSLYQQLFGSPDLWTTNGVSYWCGDSPRTGHMCNSPYTTIIDGAGVDPQGFRISDGVGVFKGQLINDNGEFGFLSTESNHPWQAGVHNIGILQFNSTGAQTLLGKKYQCTHGTNSTCGIATLSGGTITISTTAISTLSTGAAGSIVKLTPQTCSSCGSLSVGTVVDGTSFVINSTNGSDASKVYWEIGYIN